MPMVGEMVTWAGAATGKSTQTVTFSVDFPPAPVLAKVTPSFYMEYGSPGMLGVQIVSFRRRLASGADETVSVGAAPAVSDPRMTSVTFAVFIYNCQGTVVLHVEFWS
jgi:hypothetical protein